MEMIKKLSTFILSILMINALSGCNDQFDRLLPEREYIDAPDVVSNSQKILFVIVDGARGISVRDANVPNIKALTPRSTYSWTSLSDELNNAASSWTDMLTGVNKDKHGVFNESFSGNKLDRYPTVITRIKSAKPSIRIGAFSASEVFKDNLTNGANVRESFTTDDAVKDAAITEIAKDSAGIVIAEFGEVEKAGATYGFDNSFPEYKSAIEQFDARLGALVNAVKARKDYLKENWLIVVTSSRGGNFAITPSDGTIFSNASVNTFTIYANLNYGLKLVDKPFTGNRYDGEFIQLSGTNNTAINAKVIDTVANNQIFNFGDTTQFTIELKVRKTNKGTTLVPNYSYSAQQAILSKKESNTLTDLGWSVSLVDRGWQFVIGKPGKATEIWRGKDFNDGNWHSLAVVVSNRDAKRYIVTYTDGVIDGNERSLNETWGPIDKPIGEPDPIQLTLGYIDGSFSEADAFKGSISDVRIWLSPLNAATIKNYSCDTYVTSGHPNYRRLAGYWPALFEANNPSIIRDNSGTKANFYLYKGDLLFTNPQWDFISSLICPVAQGTLATLVPNTKDVAAQILSWLGIPPNETWRFEGRVWLNK